MGWFVAMGLLAVAPAAQAVRFQIENADGGITTAHDPGDFSLVVTLVAITEAGDAIEGVGWLGGNGLDVTHTVIGAARVSIDSAEIQIGPAFDDFTATGTNTDVGVRNLVFQTENGALVGQNPGDRVVIADMTVRVSAAALGDRITLSVEDTEDPPEFLANDDSEQFSVTSRLPHIITIGDPPVDQCPDDPTKINPGQCGCGVPDVDSDEDGVPDCLDACPEHGDRIDVGPCGCGLPAPDANNGPVPTINLSFEEHRTYGDFLPGEVFTVSLQLLDFVPLTGGSIQLCLGSGVDSVVSIMDPFSCQFFICPPEETDVVVFSTVRPGGFPVALIELRIGDAFGAETWLGVDTASPQTFFNSASGSVGGFAPAGFAVGGALVRSLEGSGDGDGDGDVDLADWLLLSECLRGPGQSPEGSICPAFDFNADGDIDLADVVGFQAAFTGSG